MVNNRCTWSTLQYAPTIQPEAKYAAVVYTSDNIFTTFLCATVTRSVLAFFTPPESLVVVIVIETFDASSRRLSACRIDALLSKLILASSGSA